VLRPLQDFLRTESASGVLLLVMVPLALFWANGPFADSYESFWSTKVHLGIDEVSFSLDVRHWVNDGLMALFFFVVGLEIKRELVDGQLRDRRKALTPAMAALGGMAVPALIYVAMNVGRGSVGGWGIPVATDIAIVLGVLSLLGSRVPAGLKTFLLTLAIVDDIGAILVIAIFYSEHAINWPAFGIAVLTFGAIYGARRTGLRHPVVYVGLAVAAWAATYESGLHATLAGVVLAFLTPAQPRLDSSYVDGEELADVSDYQAASQTADVARGTVSSVEWLQHLFHAWSSYFVLPVFALANAGIVVSADSLNAALTSSVAIGIVAALVVGKPVGICLFTWIATRFMNGSLPEDVQPRQVVVGSVLAGIGFTVSLFIADLAFTDEGLISEAKAGVLAASLIAGTVGFIGLRFALRPEAVKSRTVMGRNRPDEL
jgi:NhaA family Na+:H+ antiporter